MGTIVVQVSSFLLLNEYTINISLHFFFVKKYTQKDRA